MAEYPSAEDLESFRDPIESKEQWALKKSFLIKNWDEFMPERPARLAALTQCFHNIHIFGCSYPEKVMTEVKRLSDGLITPKPKKFEIPKVTFVAATPLVSISNTFSALEDVDSDSVLLDDDDEFVVDEELPPITIDETTAAVSDIADSLSSKINMPEFPFGDPSESTIEDVVKTENLSEDQRSSPNQLEVAKKQSPGKIKENSRTHTDSKDKKEKKLSAPPDLKEVLNDLNKFKKELLRKKKAFSQATSKKITAVINSVFHGMLRTVLEDRYRLLFKGVCIGSGPSNSEAYDDFRRKVFQEKPWTIITCDGQAVLSDEDSEAQVKETTEASSSVSRSPELRESGAGSPELRPSFSIPSNKPMALKKGPICFQKASDAQTADTETQSAPSNVTKPDIPIFKQLPPPVLKTKTIQAIQKNLSIVRTSLRSDEFLRKASVRGDTEDSLHELALCFNLPEEHLRFLPDATDKRPYLKTEFAGIDDSEEVSCSYYFHDVLLGKATGATNQRAKLNAAKKVLMNLKSPHFPDIKLINNKYCFVFPESTVTKAEATTPRSVEASYEGLFLVRPREKSKLSEILDATVAYTRMGSDYVFFEEDEKTKCELILTGSKRKFCFKAEGENKKLAKANAIRKALTDFHANCPTIHIKEMSDDIAEIDKPSMNLGVDGTAVQDGMHKAIDDNNLGHRLLTKMGWAGGSLGVGSRGLREPIILKQNVGMSGLGYAGPIRTSAKSDLIKPSFFKAFNREITIKLKEFLREADIFQELKFSPDFTNEERALIHKRTRALGLKSKSQNTKEGRVLCVSHNFDGHALYKNLIERGGASGKYELTPPGSWTLPAVDN